jgi:hypothetical protein
VLPMRPHDKVPLIPGSDMTSRKADAILSNMCHLNAYPKVSSNGV